MIGRRRQRAPGPDPWEEEGRRLAPQLAGLSAAVVMGSDADAVARVAIGAARATAHERHVAIADLVGITTALGGVANDAGTPGITESFVHGISLNDVARPAADGTPSLFILPRGHEPLTAELLQSERWARLVAGFAEAGALLLIVAPADAAGLETLVPRTDGVVAVGFDRVPFAWRVIAQVGDQPVVPRPAAAKPAPPSHTHRRILYGAIAVAVIIAAGVLLYGRSRPGVAHRAPVALATLHEAPMRPTAGVASADTVRVPEPVNPPDSAVAAEFSLELVATNTVAGANLWLRERGARLPGVTVSPVNVGAARVRWYKVLAGAWRDRYGADSLLAALRRDGVLRSDAGMVVRVPLSLLLEAEVARPAALVRVDAWAARGVSAYALLQDNGTVRLYAGAFETAAAAVPLDAELRAAGFAPQLVYRTGRTF